MRFPAKFPEINFLILIAFGSVWLYTEVTDYNTRAQHTAAVDQFMATGDRFTHDDGDLLELRIRILEVQCGITE